MLLLALETESCKKSSLQPKACKKAPCDYCVICDGSQITSDAQDMIRIPLRSMKRTTYNGLQKLERVHYVYTGHMCFWKTAPNQTRERFACELKEFQTGSYRGLSRNQDGYGTWTGLRDLQLKHCERMKCPLTMHCQVCA